MEDGGEHEAFLTADYNAEMIEQIARFPRLRDRALFVGNPDDIVPDALRPRPAAIRDWTEEHFDLSGYVTGFEPVDFADREALRAELGYRRRTSRSASSPSAARASAADLLRRVIDAFPEAKERVPGAADDRGRRAAHRPGVACRSTTGSRCARTSTTCTATSRRATSPSCRAG